MNTTQSNLPPLKANEVFFDKQNKCAYLPGPVTYAKGVPIVKLNPVTSGVRLAPTYTLSFFTGLLKDKKIITISRTEIHSFIERYSHG